jgi:hypothetical protein
MPTLIDRPRASDRATGLGVKRSLLIAASTARTLDSLTLAVPLRMRDTVLGDTPASAATISSVTAAPVEAESTLRSRSARRMMRSPLPTLCRIARLSQLCGGGLTVRRSKNTPTSV